MSSPRVPAGTFHRWCRRCGWKGTYSTAGRGDYAKRKHSCERWTVKLAGRQRNAARLDVDRTPKPCLHKIAEHQHGTYACYTLDLCRCLPCAAAVREYEQNRIRQQAYGRWDNYVDAEPARAHIRSLMDAGMGLKRIVAVGGSSQGQLWKLLYGKKRADGSRTPSKRLRKDVAKRLLAIQLDLADGAKISVADAVGVRRRIRALVALGWSQSKLAERLGIGRANFHLATDVRGVTIATMRAVEVLYDELSMTLPPNGSHRDKIAASRARRYAQERGWKPPLALDDELLDRPYDGEVVVQDDTPDIDEVAIQRRMAGDRSVRLSNAEKRELRRIWYDAGRSGADLERVCGMAPTTRVADEQEAS